MVGNEKKMCSLNGDKCTNVEEFFYTTDAGVTVFLCRECVKIVMPLGLALIPMDKGYFRCAQLR